MSRRGVVAGERPVGSTAPVRLITSRVVHRPYPHKLVDRERFDRALADAKAVGADDGLLLTVGGQVAETAIWGVFWWEDGRVAAPPLEHRDPARCGAGTDRRDGRAIDERKVTLEEIRGRSLFVANAVRGVVPVATLDGAAVPDSPDTEALAKRFWP